MKKNNYFTGVLFIAVALLMVLYGLGIFPSTMFNLTGFEVVSSTVLLFCVVYSVVKRWYMGIFISIALMLINIGDKIGFHDISAWVLIVAAVLLGIGFESLFSKKTSHHSHFDSTEAETLNGDDEHDIIVKCSSAVKYINSEKFSKLNIVVKAAGAEVHLENATMAEKTALVHVECAAGGLDLYIPKSWRVENRLQTILAGCDEMLIKPEVEKTNTLILDGEVKFAGVQIYYV